MSDLHAKLAKQQRLDWLFVNATRFFAVIVLLLLGGILVSLLYGALPSLKAFGINFYTSKDWDTGMDVYGALAPIYGTLITSIIAILVAVPVRGISMKPLPGVNARL